MKNSIAVKNIFKNFKKSKLLILTSNLRVCVYVHMTLCFTSAFHHFISSWRIVSASLKPSYVSQILKTQSPSCTQAFVCASTPRKYPRGGYIFVYQSKMAIYVIICYLRAHFSFHSTWIWVWSSLCNFHKLVVPGTFLC